MGNVCSEQRESPTSKKIITIRSSENQQKLPTPKGNTTYETTTDRESENSSPRSNLSSLMSPPKITHSVEMDLELDLLEEELFNSMDSGPELPEIDLRKMEKSQSFLFEGETIHNH